MQISEFRDACENLARFASNRENAAEPQDRIVLQQLGGTLKFIGGTDTMTLVVATENEADDFRAVVGARLLLSAGKALKGKGTVSIEKHGDGARLKTSTGGEVRLMPVGVRVPPYVRPQLDGVRAETAAKFWPGAVRRLKAISCKDYTFGASDLTLSVRGLDRHLYAEHPYDGLDDAEELVVPGDFVEALLGFEDPSDVILSPGTVTVKSGPYTAVTATLSASPIPSYPMTESDTAFVVDRKGFIEMVKGTAPHDEHNRVSLVAERGSISAAPWGKGDTGISLPAKVDGVGGRIGVTADYLLKLLMAIPTPKVGLAWQAGATGVIRVFGENDPWRQLLAPVVLP